MNFLNFPYIWPESQISFKCVYTFFYNFFMSFCSVFTVQIKKLWYSIWGLHCWGKVSVVSQNQVYPAGCRKGTFYQVGWNYPFTGQANKKTKTRRDLKERLQENVYKLHHYKLVLSNHSSRIATSQFHWGTFSNCSVSTWSEVTILLKTNCTVKVW